ncbi:MAG: NAD(P)-dependent oxidoreductase [Thermodesulfobacteriota bacterium]
MHILVIGASRGIGKCIVELALVRNNSVTALIRNKEKLSIQHKNLRVVEGDILDSNSINNSMDSVDCVCVTIGTGPTFKPVSVFSEGTRKVVEVMKNKNIKDLICVTGIGAGDSKNHGGFLYDKIVNPLLLKTIYEDKDRQEKIVKDSGLEWVIVRPGFLTNGPLTGKYNIFTDLSGVKAGKISRFDVADFILNEFEKREYSYQTPLIT